MVNELGVLTYNISPEYDVTWNGDWRLPTTPGTGSFATDGSSAIFYLPDHWEPMIVWPGCDLCISSPPEMWGGYVSYYFASWDTDPFGNRFGHSIGLSFGAPDYVTGVRRFTTGGVWSDFYSGSSHFFISGLTTPDRWSPQPAVPEPASLLLFGTGLVGLRAWRKRRQ